MTPASLNEWTAPLTGAMETQLTTARSYRQLPHKVLCRPPESSGWSAAQCVAHLNKYSAFYLPRMEQVLGGVPPVSDPFRYGSGFWGRLLINSVDPENPRKLPSFRSYRPAERVDAEKEFSDFIAYKERWMSLLQRVEGGNQLNARVQSSVTPLIRFRVGDVFLFMTAHDERHLRQAARAVAACGQAV